MSFIANPTIARKLIAAFAVMIIAPAAGSLAVYQNINFIEQSAGWTTHTYAGRPTDRCCGDAGLGLSG